MKRALSKPHSFNEKSVLYFDPELKRQQNKITLHGLNVFISLM